MPHLPSEVVLNLALRRPPFGTVVLFCIALAVTSSAQVLSTLASFDQSNGSEPEAPLVQGADGNFYGTTSTGGSGGLGSIFRITPSGALTTLYSFCAQHPCLDGVLPEAGLVQGTDGNFYGTTSAGGSDQGSGGGGTVFKITPDGTLTTLYRFCLQTGCTDGGAPLAGLVQGSDGNFYGTTSYGGGPNLDGTVFKITPTGSLTTLYSFCSQANCTDGNQPHAGLVQATNGDFYGTALGGGANNCGTVFKITSSGTLTTLYSFCSLDQRADGGTPQAGLVQATDGNLYGTTSDYGANDGGTIFEITPSGALTTLYSLNPLTDGSTSVGYLVQASDGNFYGTTSFTGAHGGGTAFKITPGGIFTTLYSFCSEPNCSDGTYPHAGLVQGSNGNFYGTTEEGGANGPYGTVFTMSGPALPPLQFVAVPPCRLLDTRQSGGNGPILGGTYQSFELPQLAQANGCANLSTASAYSLNVTVVPQGHLRYLTIWPTGASQPSVSLMNSQDGRVKANAAIVAAGGNRAVSVYATDTTDVILDIDGYFVPPTQGSLQFYSLTPCRVIDTRSGSNQPQGLGPPSFGAMEMREMPVLSKSPCLQNLPNQPLAYSLNVTVAPNPAGQPLSYLTVWPSDEPQPTVSTLNNPKALLVANAAVVPAAANGDISIYTRNSADVIVDIDGYFAASGLNGLSFYSSPPCRAYDSRNNNGQPFSGERTVNIADSPCVPPGNAQAYVFNATVVPSGPLGYLTLWPDSELQPVVSTLNAPDGQVTSNMAIVPNINGNTDAWAQGITQLILDMAGYFAP